MTSETGFDTGKYDRFPTTEPRPEGELEQLEKVWCGPRSPWEWLTATNNNIIGVYYVGGAMLFFILAGVLALLMRTQLALPMNGFLPQETYNQIFTMHGTVMMFLFAVPAVEGLGVLLLPQVLGARDLPFPRLGAYAFWAYLVGGLAFFCSLFFGLAPDGGWFMYPPLTSTTYSPGINADFWLLGIGFIEISAIAGAIEIIVGVLKTRAPGMTLDKLPVIAWAFLIFACMIIIAFPSIILATLLLELERALGWPFFDALKGGDPMLWQHLFWFFGHPEVYIIFLPAAGALSTIIPAMARTPLVGHNLVVMAMLATGFISFGVWAHHMFTTGMPQISINYFSAASMAVSIPAGIQVFAWIATIAAGKMRFSTPGLFAVGGLVIFVMGGLTGVMVAMVPFDWQAHDSYFIVAHLHYVLIGGMVFPVFAGFYYWAPVFNGHRLSERWGRWVFGLMFGGFNLTFFPMHIAGLMGMPRRIYTYPGDLGWNGLNMASTVGAFVLAAGVLLFFIDAVRTLRRPDRDHGNPWGAGTLEWLPARDYGVRSIPQVDSLYPLWREPDLPQQVEAGRHWLPGTIFGGRETLVTSMRDARPMHLLRLPTDGWWPFIAAVGTAGFFLLLTASRTVLAFAFGLLAIVAIVRWLWGSDQPPPTATADVGHGVRLPVGATGRASHSWWAVIVLIAVDMTIFVSFLFAHIHLSMAAEVCPPPGAALPPLRWPLISMLLLLAGSAGMAVAVRTLKSPQPQNQHALRLLVAFALLCTACALGVDLAGHWKAGLDPRDQAWSATVGMLLGYQAFHVAVLVLMGGYVLVRSWSGKLQPAARATLDNTALMWHCVTAQGLIGALTVQLVPVVLG